MKIKFAFIVMLLFLTGCIIGGTSQPEPVEVYIGTEGLEMDFMEQSPPSEVFLGEIFPVTVDMQNKGAYDIKGGVLVVSVEEYLYIRSQDYQDGFENFDLTGRSIYDPIGGVDRKTIQIEAARLDPQSETITTNIAVTACYPYKTDASATVCIDPDIFGQRQEEKVCTTRTVGMGTITYEGQDLPSGQGAPIAITRIEQKMLPHEDESLIIPSFMIYVKNMEDGLPVELGLYEKACTATGIGKDAWNVIGLNAYLSDRSVQLDCNIGKEDKTGSVKLEHDEDFIRCNLPSGIPKSRGTYTTPMMIDMLYGYTFTVSKQVLVRKQI